MNNPPNRFLTIDELAETLSISKRTVNRLVADGAPRIKVRPRLYRYDLATVIAWCKARDVQSNANMVMQ